MLRPDATNASSSLNDVGSSAVHPKMLLPKTSGPISRLEFPSLRLITMMLLYSAGLGSWRRVPRKNVSRETGFPQLAFGFGARTAFDSIAASLYTQGSWAPSLAATATASTSADIFRAPSKQFV